MTPRGLSSVARDTALPPCATHTMHGLVMSPPQPAGRRLDVALRQGLSRLWPAVFAVAPGLLLWRAVGPHRVPGLPQEPLFATLAAAGVIERWLVAPGSLGQCELALGAGGFLPAQLSVALPLAGLSSVLGLAWAYGLVLLVALWLSGLGPALLARRLLGAEALAAAVVAGLAVQLSPPVLRCAWDGQLALLAIGPVCLALAARRPWSTALWGLVSGGMGAVTALFAVVGAGVRRRPWAALALALPILTGLILALGATPDLPGAAGWQGSAELGEAYVTAGGAVFPQTAVAAGMDASPASFDWASLPARLHGGPVALLGCLLGLAWRRSRPWALLGLGALVCTHALLGPLPLPGEQAARPPSWLGGGVPWLPGGAPALELLLPILLGAGLGYAALVRWRREASALVLAVCLWTSPLLPLDRGLPVTNLPPLPAADALGELEPGPALLLPAVGEPYRQPGAGVAELLLLAVRLDRPLPLVGGDAQDPAITARTAWLANHPVELGSASLLWAAREQAPLEQARQGGYRALIVDLQAYDGGTRGFVRAELERLLGPPLAEDPRWLAWEL